MARKMARLAWGVLVVLGVAGCGPGPAAKGPRVVVQGLWREEEQALIAGTYALPANGVMLAIRSSDPQRYDALAAALRDEGISYNYIWLRNPGGVVLFLPGGGPPLEMSQRAFVDGLAKRHGVEVLKDGLIPFRRGPDGRTPIVTKNARMFLPQENNIPATIMTEMTFPSLEAAREASRYIDRKAYQVKIAPTRKGAVLQASVNMPQGGGSDEEVAFGHLAKRFRGRVEHFTVYTPPRRLTLGL
jgi:hypothetical protein